MKKLPKEMFELLEEDMSEASEGPKYSDAWQNPVFANFKISQEDHYGGEGKGSDYFTIFKLTDKVTEDDFFIKFEGYYASYEGTTWESVVEVKPVEVKKRDWKEVK